MLVTHNIPNPSNSIKISQLKSSTARILSPSTIHRHGFKHGQRFGQTNTKMSHVIYKHHWQTRTKALLLHVAILEPFS